MDEWPPFVPYLILAAVCGLASVAIVLGAVHALGVVTDTAMISIAGMSFAPAAMGIGIAAFMPRDRR
jgi:hypothetical protein